MSEFVNFENEFYIKNGIKNLPTMTRVTMAELATKWHRMLKKNYKHWKRKKA